MDVQQKDGINCLASTRLLAVSSVGLFFNKQLISLLIFFPLGAYFNHRVPFANLFDFPLFPRSVISRPFPPFLWETRSNRLLSWGQVFARSNHLGHARLSISLVPEYVNWASLVKEELRRSRQPWLIINVVARPSGIGAFMSYVASLPLPEVATNQ